MKKLLALVLCLAMVLSTMSIAVFAEETPAKGYILIIYNEDGSEAMTINGTTSLSEFKLKSAFDDAYTFVDNAFLFGIKGTPSFYLEMYEDSKNDDATIAFIKYDTEIVTNGYNLTKYEVAEGKTLVIDDVDATPAASVIEVNGTGYATFEEGVAAISLDEDNTINILTDIETDKTTVFNYDKGNITFTADSPVTVKQTKVGLDWDLSIGKPIDVVIDENVTFDIYDNASGMYLYYGPSLKLYGTITGGQNWGCLYLFYGNHTVYETGKIGVGRLQTGSTTTEVFGEVDTNYLLVEGGTFIADGAKVDANVIFDSNNGGMRWGASDFVIKNGSEVTTTKLTLGYADSEFTVDTTSTLVADKILGQGIINIDATNYVEGDAFPITGDFTGFTGKINVINDSIGNLVVVANDEGNYSFARATVLVESADGSVVPYESLDAALAAAVDGDTISLYDDVQLNTGIMFTKNGTFTIEGNGYSIAPATANKLGYQAVYFLSGKDSTFNLGNIKFENFVQTNVDGPVLRLEGAGQFNLSNITFDNCDVASTTDTTASVIRVYDTNLEADNLTITNSKGGMLMDIGPSSDSFVGKIVINNSTFENNTVLGTALIYPTLTRADNSYLAISNTTFVNNVIGDSTNATPQGRGVIHLSANAYFDGCTFDGNKVYGSHANNNNFGINTYSSSTVKYTNNVFKNNAAYQTNAKVGPVSGLAMMAFDGEISGNTVENNNKFYHRADATAEYTELPARSVGSYSESYGTVNITSGTYYGEVIAYAGDKSIAVSGGSFSVSPIAYVANGYKVRENNGLYDVYSSSAVAVVDRTYHATIQEAIEAADAGETIYVLANIPTKLVFGSPVSTFSLNNAADLVTVDLGGYVAEQGVEVNSGNVKLINGTVEDSIVVNGGGLVLENVTVDATLTVNAGTVEIISGSYSFDPTAYVVAGKKAIVDTYGWYTIVDAATKDNSIAVVFEEVNTVEGEALYNINVVNADGINRLNSADLTFEFVPVAVDGGAMVYEILEKEGSKISVSQHPTDADRYLFNYDTKEGVVDTDDSITIGQVKVTGYGSYDFSIVGTTNEVHATTVNDNVVDSYVTTGEAGKGTLVLPTAPLAGEIKVPTRELTIQIAFPNALELDNVKAYQDMKVTIEGNFEGIEETRTYNLGSDEVFMTNGGYVVTEDELVLNNAYNVTVSGAGYRTARYTVTMTEAKTLNFWNNVKSTPEVIEVGKTTGAVAVTFLAGDIVKDNSINIYDLSAVVSYFGTNNDTSAYSNYAKYDLNRDGKIDSKDVAYVLVSWEK